MIRKPNTINDGYTREMILAEPDLITRRFLIAINFYLSRRLLKSEYPAPAAPFDVKFFIQPLLLVQITKSRNDNLPWVICNKQLKQAATNPKRISIPRSVRCVSFLM